MVLFCRRTFLTQCLKGRAVRREIIPVPWSTLGKRVRAKGFAIMWGIRSAVCLQKNEAAWKGCTQSEGHRDRQKMNQRRHCDR